MDTRILKVLVVEDDKLIRKLIIHFFRDFPYAFIEAEDGKQALKMALESFPDVIITDLMLPHMDGASLIKALRVTKDFATTPIVAVTAGTEELKEQARQAGAHAVLEKPLREAEVVAMVEKLIAVTPFIKQPPA
jgi:CheY-like chemotaxis protein